MAGNELVVLNQDQLQKGGIGIDFNNPLFRLKPSTLGIVQKNTTIEGAIPGKLRVSDTNDQFDEVTAVLLAMPTEQRQYHIGDKDQLNRIPENLVCFSRDMRQPDPKSKIPQAINCANCSRNSWDQWREYKENNNGNTNKALIPPCDSSYYLVILDTKYQLPLQMFIRSKARDTFEAGMQNLARVIAMGKAQGRSPNLFDVSFKIRTKTITTGKFVSFVPTFTEFKFITDEEREHFGALYLNYVASKNTREQEQILAEAEDEVSTAQGTIDSQAVEAEYVDGEIVI